MRRQQMKVSCVFFFGGLTLLGVWEQILANVKRFFRFKIPPVWDGDFDFGQPLPNLTEDKKELRAKVEELQAMNAIEFFEQMVLPFIHLSLHSCHVVMNDVIAGITD